MVGRSVAEFGSVLVARPGPADEGPFAHALGVVRRHDGFRPRHAVSVAELPDDLVGVAIHLDDPVVELIGDQEIAWLVEEPRIGLIVGHLVRVNGRGLVGIAGEAPDSDPLQASDSDR